MKDLDKDFGFEENNGSEASYNNKPFNEVNGDVKAFEDIEKGPQANGQGVEGKSANNEKEETAIEAEGTAYGEEKGYNGFQGENDNTVRQQYSTSYAPPYYVPNFTVTEDSTEEKRKKSGRLTVLALVVGLLLISLIIIVAVFNISKILISLSSGSSIDLGDEKLSVIQNSPKISITKNTDESYIPQSLPEVVSKVGNSVVEITTSDVRSDYFYGQYVTSGAGSGVIVTQSDEAGYLLTNYHVIYGSSGELVDKITVILTNGEEYDATLMGSDLTTDLALLRIEKKSNETFTVAEFGDSSKLVVGQEVIAIGNPLGSLGGTVTDGIVSALDRRVKIDNVEMVLLQHNAAINPGNSGGALFDMMGNLVGIVNAKTSDTGIEGLGFAIPSNIAFNFLNRVMVLEPAIGIKVKYGELNRVTGLFVVETSNAQFRQYDRILQVNGENIDSAAEYYAILDCCQIGDTVTVTVKREGVQKEVRIVLE